MLWVNFQVPASARNGCSVPVLALQTFGSPSVANAAPSSAGAIQIQAQSGGAVTVISFAGQGLTAGESYSYADAGSGSLTISPGLPPSSSAQITVQVLPAPDLVTAVSVPGVTGPVQLNRHYSWIFSGITLEE
jgi:hypothetical protein